jgi:hypothetical protein
MSPRRSPACTSKSDQHAHKTLGVTSGARACTAMKWAPCNNRRNSWCHRTMTVAYAMKRHD